ncbi:MAG: FCD domain-containing protein [Victivallales bacterium]
MKGLNPVSSVTLADAVEKKIYEYISGNKMKTGDALPGEEDLSRTLDVSRNILREALSRLRMLGLVETRKKRGMTLAQPDGFIGLERMLSTGMVSEEYRKDLLELRIILELGMADYIFHRKTEKDMRELEAITSKENSGKTTRSEVEGIEIAFHSKLYEMSGNNVLKHLQGILRSFFTNIGKKSRRPSKSPAPPDHSDICKVLKNGSADEFRRVMHEHLSVYKDF